MLTKEYSHLDESRGGDQRDDDFGDDVNKGDDDDRDDVFGDNGNDADDDERYDYGINDDGDDVDNDDDDDDVDYDDDNGDDNDMAPDKRFIERERGKPGGMCLKFNSIKV